VVFGRHGEDITATDTFLRAVRPKVIVLNQADPFRDGSDEPALRARLAATGAALFDQSVCGAVVITFRRDRASVRGFLDGQSVDLAPH
jgi:beta-lactamase superfamily II metal-dependent hydrolase